MPETSFNGSDLTILLSLGVAETDLTGAALANCTGLNLPGLMEAMMPGRIIASIKPGRFIEWFFRAGGCGLFFCHAGTRSRPT